MRGLDTAGKTRMAIDFVGAIGYNVSGWNLPLLCFLRNAHKEKCVMSVPLSDEQKEEITISDLAILVFRLEKEGKVSIQNLQGLLQQLCPENKRDHAINNHPNQEFTLKFYEAMALLKRRGLLMDVLDLGYAMTPMPAVRPTSVWKKSFIEDEIIILIDKPQEIIASLKEQISNLDPVVEQYYLESLHACQEGLYIASVICLGAASEKVIHCLADAVIRYDSNYDSKIRRYRNRVSKLIDYLSANVENIFDSVADTHYRTLFSAG